MASPGVRYADNFELARSTAFARLDPSGVDGLPADYDSARSLLIAHLSSMIPLASRDVGHEQPVLEEATGDPEIELRQAQVHGEGTQERPSEPPPIAFEGVARTKQDEPREFRYVSTFDKITAKKSAPQARPGAVRPRARRVLRLAAALSMGALIGAVAANGFVIPVSRISAPIGAFLRVAAAKVRSILPGGETPASRRPDRQGDIDKRARERELDRLIDALGTAIRANPSSPNAYVNRGRAWARRGDTVRAIADFRKALVLDPNVKGALEALADLGVVCPQCIDAGR